MTDNTDNNALAAGVHHMQQINKMRAEWMAEYGIETEIELMPDVEACDTEACDIEEELLARVRQYRNRDLSNKI